MLQLLYRDAVPRIPCKYSFDLIQVDAAQVTRRWRGS
jgi:hypothetical protein